MHLHDSLYAECQHDTMHHPSTLLHTLDTCQPSCPQGSPYSNLTSQQNNHHHRSPGAAVATTIRPCRPTTTATRLDRLITLSAAFDQQNAACTAAHIT